MNAKKAKRLRREAREELGAHARPRELFIGSVHGDTSRTTARNDPFSGRGFYRGLKKALKAVA